MKKVCMFVWNHFTNDARVLRECTALAEAGYEVDLIALGNPNDKELKDFEKINGFNVTRVSRYPKFLILIRKCLNKLKENKLFLLLAIILFIGFLIKLPIITLIMSIIGLTFIMPKTKGVIIKIHIIKEMIKTGLKKDYDVYHSNDLNTLPQVYICSKLFKKKKLVYDSHEVQSSRTGYSKNVYYIEKFFINRVDRMLMTTNTRADYTRDLYKIRKPEVIHNYPFHSGDESIKNKYDLYDIAKIDREKPILLYQGGIQQGRGLENIVKAIKGFNDGIVVFIGDGKIKENLKALVKEEKVEEKVRFIDKVPVNELKYYTANAYLGFQVLNNVCFNHYSALSNKLFEYIMSDVPVVACDFPEIKKIVEGEKVGLTVDSHKPEEIIRAVNELLENKEYYNQAKKNCSKTKEKYNWNNEKRIFITIYDELTLNA